MKTRIVLACLLLLASLNFSFGQGKLEYSGFFDSYYQKGKQNINFTLNLGLPFYRGDLCEACFTPGIGFGLGANYKIWPRVMFGVEFHYLTMKGDDKDLKRNISFTSNNLEFIGYGRFFFNDDIIRVAADRGRKPKFLKSYVVAGIGLLKYNPTSRFTEPFPPTDSSFLIDEGRYNGLGFIVPLGLGLSWRISNQFTLVTEAGYRLTFTDYLDDVSLRGNPKKNDGYGMIDIKLQYSPWMPKKKKAKTLAPPDKYDGPKGTDTWKNRKKEEPARKNNYYDDETPVEETPTEETPAEETPQEEPLPEGW
jgi:hypothetical protein